MKTRAYLKQTNKVSKQTNTTENLSVCAKVAESGPRQLMSTEKSEDSTGPASATQQPGKHLVALKRGHFKVADTLLKNLNCTYKI